MKNFAVIFSPIAIDDAEQAVDYYEKKQAGLGKRFAGQLLRALNSIKRNPFFASVRYDDIRCARIKNSHILFTTTLMKMNLLLLSLQFIPLTKNHFGKLKKLKTFCRIFLHKQPDNETNFTPQIAIKDIVRL